MRKMSEEPKSEEGCEQLQDMEKEKKGIGRYIPFIMAVGVVLTAYKFMGVSKWVTGDLSTRELEGTYDYIIVGAGTSGAVLASRLTEDGNKKVLLLDAGGDPRTNELIDIPIFADRVKGSEFDWAYQTVPQKHACKSHANQEASWPSGKGLGGSSNLNYMQYLRGNRHDYDGWATQFGAQGWSYKDVLPYFIKSEDNRNGQYVRSVFHGFGGRLTVQDVQLSALQRILTDTCKEIGVKIRDTNGNNQFGYGHTQATVRNGLRWGTFRAFLTRAMLRDNLQVMQYAQVHKVLFEGKKAVGVVFKQDGKMFTVKATKEVILSAGTVGTAKLLLLSGVGPRNHLTQMKIPVVSDVPVGENLQDHVMGDGIEFFTEHSVSITAVKADNFATSWAWTLFGTGMKMSPRFREGTMFIRTRHQPPHMKYPLLALSFVASVNTYDGASLNIKDEAWEAAHGKPPSKEGFTVFPILLHPRSKGTVRLASTNPEDPPKINPNYLSEDADVKILTEAVHFARHLTKTKPFQYWDFKLTNQQLPECAKYGNWTDSYIECHLRHITLSGYAPVGTARIGAMGDPSAVVDPLLRVRGVKGLRVVDASIIPAAMSGNTYATQVMIAEKAADMLREKNTVKPIQEYFKHLIAVKHKKIMEDDDHHENPTVADLSKKQAKR